MTLWLLVGAAVIGALLGGGVTGKIQEFRINGLRSDITQLQTDLTWAKTERDSWKAAAGECSEKTAAHRRAAEKALADARKRAQAASAGARAAEDRAAALEAILSRPGGSGLGCEAAVARVKEGL